jgi:peptidoglycan/LPS O-acetylase OafA/YrhL
MVGHFSHYTAVGSLGVALFYVLSGFLITWLLEREYLRTKTVNIGWFYARRALRIFPAFYLFLLASIIILPLLNIHLAFSEWMASALYVNDYYSALHFRPSTALTHTWSLGVEEKFYLLWPLLFMALRRGGVRRVRLGLCLALLVAVIWRAYLLVIIGVRPHYAQFAFDTRFDYLAAGCLLAFLPLTFSPREPVGGRHSSVPHIAGVLSATGLIMLTASLSWDKRYAISFPLEWLLLGLLVWSVLSTQATGLWAALTARPIRWIGRISYGVYLYHKVMWLILLEWFGSRLWAGVAVGPATLLAAAASYYLLERHFLRMKRRVTVIEHAR